MSRSTARSANWYTYPETDRARIKPFEAIELDLAALWARTALDASLGG